MKPLLLKVGSLEFHAYPTMLALAFLVGTLLAVRHLNRLNPPIRVTTMAGVVAFFGGLIGAKAFWILQYDDPRLVWQAFFFWTRGLVFYGGLIGAVAALAAYLLYNRFPIMRTADACAPYLALGQAITRVGCFLTGCCWGRETSVPWAMSFPKGSSVHWYMAHMSHEIPSTDAFTPALHPTQLYMILGLALVVFPLALYVARRGPFHGAAALSYMFAYGVLRFTVESFRGDSGHPLFGMTLSQLISLGLCAVSLVLFVWRMSTVLSQTAPNTPVEDPAE